ncbi:Macrophage Metalloelastase [Manis pentadactyla]|nr:Macrophage Metalloelastase [Manis pentadactyla]
MLPDVSKNMQVVVAIKIFGFPVDEGGVFVLQKAQKIHRTANIIASDNWGSGVSVAAQIEKKNELFGKKSWLSMKGPLYIDNHG